MRQRDVEMSNSQFLSSVQWRTQSSKQIMCAWVVGSGGGTQRLRGGAGEGRLAHHVGTPGLALVDTCQVLSRTF